MKPLTSFLLASFILVSFQLSGQEPAPSRIHEIGIQFNNLNSFGVRYKTGGTKTLARITLLSLSWSEMSNWGRSQDSIDNKGSSYGIGLQAGFEKRVPLVAGLDFLWGLDAGCGFTYRKDDFNSFGQDLETAEWHLTPGLIFVIGASYTIKEHLVISAEIYPMFGYDYGKTTNTSPKEETVVTTSHFRYGFSNNWAGITFAYRFGK